MLLWDSSPLKLPKLPIVTWSLIVANVAIFIVEAAASPHSPEQLVGASGAIAGVLAAYLMFKPCQKVMVFLPWFIVRPVVRLDAFWVLGRWILVQFWQTSAQTHHDVAYMAHVGGLIAGTALFPTLRYRAVRLFECMREPEQPASGNQIS
jgi:membrane associated rhomboid family serine protease